MGARVPAVESPSSLSLELGTQNLPEGSLGLLFIEELMRPLESLLDCWRSLLGHKRPAVSELEHSYIY